MISKVWPWGIFANVRNVKVIYKAELHAFALFGRVTGKSLNHSYEKTKQCGFILNSSKIRESDGRCGKLYLQKIKNKK